MISKRGSKTEPNLHRPEIKRRWELQGLNFLTMKGGKAGQKAPELWESVGGSTVEAQICRAEQG